MKAGRAGDGSCDVIEGRRYFRRRARIIRYLPKFSGAEHGGASRGVLDFGVGDDIPGADGGLQRGVITFGLVGVGEAKSAHSLVESVTGSEIACDRRRLAALGMGAGQHLAAHPPAVDQRLEVEGFDQWPDLGVTELTNLVSRDQTKCPKVPQAFDYNQVCISGQASTVLTCP